MTILNELEGLEKPAEPQKPKRKPKAAAAPPKPPPTPEELAAAAAYVHEAREACAARESIRDTEREAARLATYTGKPMPGGQVYWSTSGRMLCGKCHRYCDHAAIADPARCMGHGKPVDSATRAEIRASLAASAALMHEEEQRRRASRLAGRIAGRSASQARAWR